MVFKGILNLSSQFLNIFINIYLYDTVDTSIEDQSYFNSEQGCAQLTQSHSLACNLNFA